MARINPANINVASQTWDELKRWAAAEIADATVICTTVGKDLIETERARERIAVLRQMLDSVVPPPVIADGPQSY